MGPFRLRALRSPAATGRRAWTVTGDA